MGHVGQIILMFTIYIVKKVPCKIIWLGDL